MVEAGGELGQVRRLPGSDRALEQTEAVRVERPEERPDGGAERAAVVQPGALDQAGQVRVLGQVVEQAVDVPLDLGRVEPPAAALLHQRDDRRDATRERRLVEGALVREVVVEARLVAEPHLRRDLAHGDAGEATIREAALGGVEDRVARRRRFGSRGRRRACVHGGRLIRTNVRLSTSPRGATWTSSYCRALLFASDAMGLSEAVPRTRWLRRILKPFIALPFEGEPYDPTIWTRRADGLIVCATSWRHGTSVPRRDRTQGRARGWTAASTRRSP